jgi:toluene monooxygenase system protein E
LTDGRPPARKTYSRLAVARRLPTEYELVSSDLHYNYPDGFELTDTPVIEWYRRHREGSKLNSTGWETFADPRRTTYRSYTELQDRKEDLVDGLLRQVDDEAYDEALSEGWVDFLDRWYAPLRFPSHGLQMLAAYVAQMAPSSRVTNCAAFQAADEMRRVQRIAYRTAQLADHGPAVVVTNVVIKPYFDRLVNLELAGGLATLNHDPVLRHVHFSLDEDARWHREWSRLLLGVAITDKPENADVLWNWINAWRPLAAEAAGGLTEIMSTAPEPLDAELSRQRIEASVSEEIDSLVMPPPSR